jgi:hypothetical protein
VGQVVTQPQAQQTVADELARGQPAPARASGPGDGQPNGWAKRRLANQRIAPTAYAARVWGVVASATPVGRVRVFAPSGGG